MFDLQQLVETEHMIFGADYVSICPRTNGCTLHLANSCHPLDVGQLVLLAPFNPYRLSFAQDQTNRPNGCDVLHFRLNALGQTFVDSVQFNTIKSMLELSKNGLLFEGPELGKIEPILDRMENTFAFSQVLNLLEFLEKLSHQKASRHLIDSHFEISNVKRTENRVLLAQTYIAKNLAEPLSVAMVASQLHMAESTFSRFFHTNLGVTFRQYVIEQRVRQAARYLVATDWTIAHIGSEVGFSSLSNFNAKFKSLLRVTPREYRANHVDMRKDISNSVAVEGQINNQFSKIESD